MTNSERRFSVASIPAFVSRLTLIQKNVFDQVWNHFVATGKPYPLRSLPQLIGKRSIDEAFDGLNGSLIYETQEQGDRCFQLTTYGALLTGSGSALAVLLVRLLDLVVELYEQDSLIKRIDHYQIDERLNISKAESDLLFKLLRLTPPPRMPIYLAGWNEHDASWSISINDDVIGLYRAESSVTYLDDCLSAGYKADEPYNYDQRLSQMTSAAGFQQSDVEMFGATGSPQQYRADTAYVSTGRIEAVKKAEDSRFDCTRLICLCEELNNCAEGRNAHAVIMLTRAILDHIAPVFGYTSFKEVASNYGGGGQSFKKSAERMENHSRKVADRLLHMPMRDKELAPNMHEVDFSAELETLLAEMCRLLK